MAYKKGNIPLNPFKKGHVPWNGKQDFELKCGQCYKSYLVKLHRKDKSKFCSLKCKHLSMIGRTIAEETKQKMRGLMKGERHWNWQGGKINKLPNCLGCNKKLTVFSAKRCHKCLGMSRRGEKHFAWITDRTKLVKRQERNDSSYHSWRREVWLRDNFKCKIANPDCKGRIEAHHILGWTDYPELRYEINNGITLCHAHHPRKRAEEKRLSPYFQSLVSVSEE